MSFKETFLLNKTSRDIEIDAVKRIKIVSGSTKVQQDLDIIFRTQRTSDILHDEFGLDAFAIIQRPTENVIDQKIREALLDYQFLDEINKLEIALDKQNRVATITIEAEVEGNPESLSVKVGF